MRFGNLGNREGEHLVVAKPEAPPHTPPTWARFFVACDRCGCMGCCVHICSPRHACTAGGVVRSGPIPGEPAKRAMPSGAKPCRRRTRNAERPRGPQRIGWPIHKAMTKGVANRGARGECGLRNCELSPRKYNLEKRRKIAKWDFRQALVQNL